MKMGALLFSCGSTSQSHIETKQKVKTQLIQ